MSTLKPFDITAHLGSAITRALVTAPPGAAASPETLVSAMFSLGCEIAGRLGVDAVAMISCHIPGVEADEDRAVAMVRACYAAKRGATTDAQGRN